MELTSQTIGVLAGWLGLSWVGLEGLFLAARMLRRQAHARRQLATRRLEFVRRVERTAFQVRAEKNVPDWEGWRTFRVAAIADEARDVKSFYFTPQDAQPLARFAPGQYLTFRLPKGGALGGVVRCYSLSDRPREDFYRCTIKRIGPPRDMPNAAPGRGSSFFHDVLQVGDVLDVRAPAGTFYADPQGTEPTVLVGAGIGVTPLVSMLEAIIHAGRQRPLYALFGFRNGGEHPFRDRLAQLAKDQANLRLHVSYSSPRAEDVLYRDYNHVGRMTFDRVKAILPSNNFRFYVCGPGEMMESLVPALRRWGVPESHVQFEAFGPASVRRIAGAAAKSDTNSSCPVRFERSGRTLRWSGEQGPLLDLADSAGLKLSAGCRAGSCGECAVPVRSGNVKTLKRPGINVPPGHCLTCISVPDGELVLDA